jgi:protein-tyrosine phosphatase
MAEGFLNSVIMEDPILSKHFSASSAGIMAINGDSASPNSVQLLKDNWGIDIGSHQAKLIEYEDIKDAYLVLTMTRKHKDALIRLFPHMKSKLYTLKEYAEGKNTKDYFGKDIADNYDFTLDILDPYGMPIQIYRQCARDIKEAIDKIVEKLKQEGDKS